MIKPKELHESLTTDEDTQLGIPIGNNDSAKQGVIIVNNRCESDARIIRQESCKMPDDSRSHQEPNFFEEGETIIHRGIAAKSFDSRTHVQPIFRKGDIACRDKHGKEVLHEFDHGARVQLAKTCKGKKDGRIYGVGFVARRTACYTILRLEDGTEIRRAPKNLTLLSA